ncbi:MAG TPA: ABC transporter permease, partial [Magnetospirillum sp.]|nr:ABC transporter permease [Magnetospirillum sp.]
MSNPVTAPANSSAVAAAPVSGAAVGPAKSFSAKWLIGFALPLTLALGWELAVALKFSDGRLLPTPSKVIMTLVGLAKNGELQDHILATLQRVALGFAFGVAAATVIGAVSGYWTGVRRVIDPTLQA